ncbi:hypothetical protein STAN_0231 [Streptomyces sp. CBMAI 2042]|nr:hypothetical protein STAN_0231 [Streptomyces sp. CBMAI 2042]
MGGDREYALHGREGYRVNPVVDPGTAPFRDQQPCLTELSQMMRDRRLRHSHIRYVAHAGLAFPVRRDSRQQAKTDRVAESLEELGRYVRLLAAQGPFGERRTAQICPSLADRVGRGQLLRPGHLTMLTYFESAGQGAAPSCASTCRGSGWLAVAFPTHAGCLLTWGPTAWP